MIKELKKHQVQREKIKGSECENIAGSKLESFAEFWEKCGDELEVLAAVKLHNFCSMKIFTKEELAAYKLGLGEIGTFFQQCWQQKQKDLEK